MLELTKTIISRKNVQTKYNIFREAKNEILKDYTKPNYIVATKFEI